ncbi:Tetratricopeptide repeat-containing protein [Saccharopolyspora shandongensis]|uniref:Tetratricopeptide repeat-containing protein n=2 Tax=Saccharopolyspora shandongensis TaxID=418495 RepID=A0A1H3G7Y3_9PSEU|nr:Tetratricopeptide repeat-containing protein [Saccharopolyspora shandongensis]
MNMSAADSADRDALEHHDDWLDRVSTLMRTGRYAQAREIAGRLWQAWRFKMGHAALPSWQIGCANAWACYRTGHYAELGHIVAELGRILGEATEDIGEWQIEYADLKAVHARIMGEFADELIIRNSVVEQACSAYGNASKQGLRLELNRASALRLLGRFTEAHQLDATTANAYTEQHGPNDPSTLRVQAGLAMDLRELGQYDAAVNMGRRVLSAHREALSPDHPFVLGSQRMLAVTLQRAGKPHEAYNLAGDAYQRLLKQDERGQDTAATLAVMASTAADPREGANHGMAAVDMMRTAMGPDHPFTLVCEGTLAVRWAMAGAHHRACALANQVVDRSVARLGVAHPQVAVYAANLAGTLGKTGETEQALRMRHEAAVRAAAALGAKHPVTLTIERAWDWPWLYWDTMQL